MKNAVLGKGEIIQETILVLPYGFIVILYALLDITCSFSSLHFIFPSKKKKGKFYYTLM